MSRRRTRLRQWALLGLLGGAAYAYHVHHMLHVLFDYGLNVTVCVVIGLLQVPPSASCTCSHQLWLTQGSRQVNTFCAGGQIPISMLSLELCTRHRLSTRHAM